jgi:adenylate kinase family enzyme
MATGNVASMMRRILILGCSGSGKSTLATTLGQRLGLPVIHLDAHFLRPGWVALEKDEWTAKVATLLEGERWVMDGNYGSSLALRLGACDTAIYLDRVRLTCFWRLCKRWFKYRGRTRPDLTEGCPERMDWEFYRWVWRFPRDVRPGMLAGLREQGRDKRIFILKSEREVAAFLADLAETNGAHQNAGQVRPHGEC